MHQEAKAVGSSQWEREEIGGMEEWRNGGMEDWRIGGLEAAVTRCAALSPPWRLATDTGEPPDTGDFRDRDDDDDDEDD
jgi:hypothetical protein